jgi:feruloyl esterase
VIGAANNQKRISVRYRRLQSLFRDSSIILRFLSIAFVVSVLLFISKASLFQTSAIAQIPMQPMPSNPCSALIHRDFAAIPDDPTAILSAQVVPVAAQTPEYSEVKGYVTPQVQFEVHLPTQNWNRPYLQVSCGGYCGGLRATPESIAALNQNFAVVFDNTGWEGDKEGYKVE